MNNTNQMLCVPCELLEQALDAAAAVGMQDVADELDRILTPDQHQGEALGDAGTSVIACQVDESCGQSAPVERDERAEFDRIEGQKFLNWYRGRYGVTPMAAGDRSIGEYAAWLARAALERKPSALVAPASVPVSSIREEMERQAARGSDTKLQIGKAHLRVTYHGIKWHHERRHCNRREPLSIEEFDEILTTALTREANHE